MKVNACCYGYSDMKLDTGGATSSVVLPKLPLRPYPKFEHEIGVILPTDGGERKTPDVTSAVPMSCGSNTTDSHSESGVVDTVVDMTCTINVSHASNLPGVVGSTPSSDDGMPAVEGV